MRKVVKWKCYEETIHTGGSKRQICSCCRWESDFENSRRYKAFHREKVHEKVIIKWFLVDYEEDQIHHEHSSRNSRSLRQSFWFYFLFGHQNKINTTLNLNLHAKFCFCYLMLGVGGCCVAGGKEKKRFLISSSSIELFLSRQKKTGTRNQFLRFSFFMYCFFRIHIFWGFNSSSDFE